MGFFLCGFFGFSCKGIRYAEKEWLGVCAEEAAGCVLSCASGIIETQNRA